MGDDMAELDALLGAAVDRGTDQGRSPAVPDEGVGGEASIPGSGVPDDEAEEEAAPEEVDGSG